MSDRSRRESDAGFTLAEMSIVVILIGLLAAIAIPALIGQRSKGVDATLNLDLKSAGNSMSFWLVDNPSGMPVGDLWFLPEQVETALGPYGLRFKPGSDTKVYLLTRGADRFCIAAFSPASKKYNTLETARLYDSSAGAVVERSAVKPGWGCAA